MKGADMKLITSILVLVTFGIFARRPRYTRSEMREVQRRLESIGSL
jgi:hypothetical protein